MVDSRAATDFYSVLQVHPNADHEIIEAAYRQLMKKYHPDMAGSNAALAAEYHQRAKLINQAHGVLGDPVQRLRYDSWRTFGGGAPASPGPHPSQATNPRGAGVATGQPARAWEPPEAPAAWIDSEAGGKRSAVRGPLSALIAAYYLLPGPYEWEGGRTLDVLATCLLPVLGISAFALATGRLAPIVGHSVGANLLASGLLFLCTLPFWSLLPRMAMASVPSLLLMTGAADLVLRQANVPAWLAWAVLGFSSLLLSARLYVFSVLPMLAGCWLLARLA